MTPTPLEQIGFRWRDHKSALWWLSLLYTNPIKLHSSFNTLPASQALNSELLLFAHCSPYLIASYILGRIILFAIIPVPTYPPAAFASVPLLFHITAIIATVVFALGLMALFGAFLGNAMALLNGINAFIIGNDIGWLNTDPRAMWLSMLQIVAMGVVFSSVSLFNSIHNASSELSGKLFRGSRSAKYKRIGIGITCLTLSAIYFRSSRRLSLSDQWNVFLNGNPVIMALALFFLAVGVLRLYYYLIHCGFLWLELKPSWYIYHPAAWDHTCLVSFMGLNHLLVSYAESSPFGEAEIERLIAESASQRSEALRAKAILSARKTGRVTDLSKLDEILAQLPEGKKGYLSETQEVRAWVGEISHLQIRLNTINRPAFREPTAELLVKEIENFRHRIAGLHEPLATEFRAAATQWLAIAERQLDEARCGATRELTPQVFRAGDPVDREQEAFVPRYAVIGELEQQIMLSTGCPGIVLYGRKRTGKSTILRNLTGFLPTDVVTALFSMQKPHLFTSLESAVRAISHEIQKQLPASNIGADSVADLRGFYDLLTRCNEQLETDGKRLMLAVDEYENIDAKIGEGIFPRDLLDTIRESIQTHRRITWIFAGSHEIYELKNAAWTSYLVSARTIEVPSFTLAETQLLLTEPLKHSSLWRGNEAKRPRFDASFWGEGGIERIHSEAGGWPHLVQLIVETIVDVLNNEEASEVTPELMERALDKSIVSGQIVLYQLMHDESTLPGEWDYLAGFRRSDSQPAPVDEKIALSLRRRMLVVEENGDWRLRVPLMARWLRVRGQ